MSHWNIIGGRIEVSSCNDCPFAHFEDATCQIDRAERGIPERGMPDWCPLRLQTVVIALVPPSEREVV